MIAELLLIGLAFVAAVPYVLFTVTYVRRTRWKETASGRALMISTPAVAVLLLTEVAMSLLPVPERVELIVTTATLTLLLIGGLLKYGALLHELRVGKREGEQ